MVNNVLKIQKKSTKSDKFKLTDVGTIPEDWNVKLLPEICNFQSGKAHEQWVSDLGKSILVNSKFISSEGKIVKFTAKNRLPAKRGDILMVMSDLPNGRALAKAFVVDRDNCYAVNQRICALTPYKDNPEYLYYVLNRNKYFLKFDDGVNQTHLLNPVFLKCPVPLPPTVKEQQIIAEVLLDVDALIESLESLITKKRAIKQGVMQKLLSGSKRLSGFTEKWKYKMVGEVLSVKHGKSQHEVVTEDGQYPILATGGPIGMASAYLYDLPSVLIGRKGTIDRPQYIDKPFWTVDTLFYSIMKAESVAKYFYYQFQLIDWYSYNEASGVPSLNARTIEKIEIAVPEVKEQRAIVHVLSDLDEEIFALDARLIKARQLKQGMRQNLLTGRVRLI